MPAANASCRRLAPVEPRYAPLFCFALLTGSCALASFAFACATPFAAFGVIAAAMLPLPTALVVVAGTWCVNQGIGFAALHYPIDANTILWGFVIGAAALAATAASSVVLRTIRHVSTPIVMAGALIGAYAAYELVLFAATPILGGADNFTASIVARLAILSGLWAIGLFAACEATRRFNLAIRHQPVS